VRRSENLLVTLFGGSKGTTGELHSEDINPYSPKKKEREYC